jgi:hypothetical protein
LLASVLERTPRHRADGYGDDEAGRYEPLVGSFHDD